MVVKSRSEYKIGPFDYDDAKHHIKKYALALTNLGLGNRFSVDPWPRRVVDTENGRPRTLYQVVIVDKYPDRPCPEGLTTFKIKAAESRGYRNPAQHEDEEPEEPEEKRYRALGRVMTLSQWAEAADIDPSTLKVLIDGGMTMKEAITQIALKKAS